MEMEGKHFIVSKFSSKYRILAGAGIIAQSQLNCAIFK